MPHKKTVRYKAKKSKTLWWCIHKDSWYRVRTLLIHSNMYASTVKKITHTLRDPFYFFSLRCWGFTKFSKTHLQSRQPQPDKKSTLDGKRSKIEEKKSKILKLEWFSQRKNILTYNIYTANMSVGNSTGARFARHLKTWNFSFQYNNTYLFTLFIKYKPFLLNFRLSQGSISGWLSVKKNWKPNAIVPTQQRRTIQEKVLQAYKGLKTCEYVSFA